MAEQQLAGGMDMQPPRVDGVDGTEVLTTLHDLIQACEEEGVRFKACAEYVQRLELCWLFAKRAVEYAQAAHDLQDHARRLGDDTPRAAVTDVGGVKGRAMHSGWIAMRGALSSYNELSLLRQRERGEHLAIDRYRKALERQLPESVRALLERQSEGLQRSCDQIMQTSKNYIFETASLPVLGLPACFDTTTAAPPFDSSTAP